MTADRQLEAGSYRHDIDGLRAFAVLAVLLYHAFPTVVRGGFVGVDVFFVISGFLISSILFAEIGEHRFSLTAFYGRRIRRIFPALAVCLAAVLAYGFVVLLPVELAQLGKHVFFGAGFLSNIALWREAGYFATSVTLKPLLHLWSLGIEEQFYIFWPVLLWLAFRLKLKTAPLLVILFLGSFAINIVLSYVRIVADFYLPISRAWELLAGAALAYRGQLIISPTTRSWASTAGAAALLISAALFTPDMRFPGWVALLPVAGTVALIVAGSDAVVNRSVLSNRAAVAIGLISYPLYLWHWPLISYAHIIFEGRPLSPLLTTSLLAASFLLAWITYRFVERPVRFGARRHLFTVITATCMVALGVFGLVTWIGGGFPARVPALQKISDAELDADFKPTVGMEVSDYNRTVLTHIGAGERKVALGGDSLLFHYGPRAQQLADDGSLAASVYFVSGGSCAPVPGIVRHDDFAHCANLPSLLADLVKREKVRSVVLGASWMGYRGAGLFIERDGNLLPLDTKDGQDAFYANLEDYIRALQRDGATVYLVLTPPVAYGFKPEAMAARSPIGIRLAPDFDKAVSIADMRATTAPADEALRTVAQHTGAKVLDPYPDLCGNGDGCPPLFDAGEPKFSDGMHLRPIFVRGHLHFLDFLLRAP
jgi:peptidoglycan/LPS O-acetylase OafA/YrhL